MLFIKIKILEKMDNEDFFSRDISFSENSKSDDPQFCLGWNEEKSVQVASDFCDNCSFFPKSD